MQGVRLGRRIDVATRGRSAHPSLLRMLVGAARPNARIAVCRAAVIEKTCTWRGGLGGHAELLPINSSALFAALAS